MNKRATDRNAQTHGEKRCDHSYQQVTGSLSFWRSRSWGLGVLSALSPVAAQAQYIVKPVAEMKVKQLPKGELYWRVESFPTLEKAKAAAPPYRWNPDTVSYDGLPSLTAEVAGKAWLFTLGPKGGATPGGTKVAEIGPVPPLSAPEYLLRVNYGHGPPGAKTPVHSHCPLSGVKRT